MLYANNKVNVVDKPAMIAINAQESNQKTSLYTLLSSFAAFKEEDFNSLNLSIKKYGWTDFTDKITYYWNVLVKVFVGIMTTAAIGFTYKFCAITGIGELLFNIFRWILKTIRERTRIWNVSVQNRQARPYHMRIELEPLQQVWANAPPLYRDDKV